MSPVDELRGSSSHRAHAVYLFGNGLARTFSEAHYNLPTITQAVQELASEVPLEGGTLLDALKKLAAANNPDQVSGLMLSDFEHIAGPIDRLAHSLSEVTMLVGLANTEAEKALILALSDRLRSIYKRVVGAALVHVTQHSEATGNWAPINQVAEHLTEVVAVQHRLDVFTINYDALLDSALLQISSTHEDFKLADEFRGYSPDTIPVLMREVGLQNVPAFPWREDFYAPTQPLVRLHHLHGAATWLTYQGTVYKARSLEQIREGGLFTAWVYGVEGHGTAGQVEPTVILGDQKARAVKLDPFVETYQALVAAVQRSTCLVIAGYSFKDRPLNRVLRSFVRDDAQVVVIDPGPGVESAARAALGFHQNDGRLTIVPQGLPDGLRELPHLE